jgi:hypothetical protein
MKNYPWIILSAGLLALAFAPQACGGGSSNGGGGATSTGTGPTTGTTSHTTTPGTGGTVGGGGTGGSAPLTCTDVLDPTGSACSACADDKCCDLVTACANDADCPTCYSGNPDAAFCKTNAPFTALAACEESSCKTDCTVASDCNPVTSKECTTSGDGCDVVGGAYTCLSGATEAECAACDANAGPWCGPGLTCLADNTGAGKCARFCCADTDCGTGKCDKTIAPGGVGLCVTTAGAAACDAPATSPSGGSCFTLTAADGG